MRKFIEEHEWEVLLILITMIGIARWWVPSVAGFQNIYGASHWAMSYDYGLVRRGLIGTIVKLWVDIVTINDVHRIALAAYVVLLAWLMAIFYALLKHQDDGKRLFRLIFLFIVNPATLALLARNLGRFDLFLVIITLVSITLLSLNRHIWLIPLLMLIAMFVHEGFLILWAPTIVAGLIFLYVVEKGGKGILVTLVISVLAVTGAFFIIYQFGRPAMAYDEFFRAVQSRAAFTITDLSMRECYYSIGDHVSLASSSLYDAGSIVNLIMAVLILSPVILVLSNLWWHALRNSGPHRNACLLFLLATMSGLILIPIATDYGRWLSAITFCNFFAIFFLLKKDIIKGEQLREFTGGKFSLLFVLIVLTYLLFGPFHDWNPYPYRENVVYSTLSIIAVLIFDIGFIARWREVSRSIAGSGQSSR